VGGSCLAKRLAHYIALSEAERAALSDIEGQERSYKRGSVIRQEHDAARELLVVQKGWLHSFVILDNGSRQITRLHFPGDIAGVSGLAFEKSSDCIVAVTDAVVAPFDKGRLTVIFERHPRLAALLFALTVAERVSIADRLAAIGRTSARSRVALILCKMFTRLKVIEGGALQELQIPLTQEDIGDTIGLTAVHVNRMMRELANDGLIERSGSTIRILDEKRLAAEANFIDRYARIDTSWIPQAR
jgi:CRP-like cAMP-binding protein